MIKPVTDFSIEAFSTDRFEILELTEVNAIKLTSIILVKHSYAGLSRIFSVGIKHKEGVSKHVKTHIDDVGKLMLNLQDTTLKMSLESL